MDVLGEYRARDAELKDTLRDIHRDIHLKARDAEHRHTNRDNSHSKET